VRKSKAERTPLNGTGGLRDTHPTGAWFILWLAIAAASRSDGLRSPHWEWGGTLGLIPIPMGIRQ